jgi:23S rRNA pseudouridine2605 synthase
MNDKDTSRPQKGGKRPRISKAAPPEKRERTPAPRAGNKSGDIKQRSAAPGQRDRTRPATEKPDRPFGSEGKRFSSDRPDARKSAGMGAKTEKVGYRKRDEGFSDKEKPKKAYGPPGQKPSRPGTFSKRDGDSSEFGKPRRQSSKQRPDSVEKDSFRSDRPKRFGTASTSKKPSTQPRQAEPAAKELIRLNKYLADAGICSRREADTLIQAGTVTVNGVIVTELGTKVSVHDKVIYGGQALKREKPQYVLLNKPKGYITTSDDPYDRKTVMELVAGACSERIYPVGRLDRNTLGLLLLTNDGDLAKKLTHPKHGAKKLYHVELDKPLTKNDMLRIAAGIELEDGLAEVDAIAWVKDADSKKEVGIELHAGRNRIVRRIFEHLGYNVVKLDRVIFAGLTKLNLTRGRWRFLTSTEISMLKRIK